MDDITVEINSRSESAMIKDYNAKLTQWLLFVVCKVEGEFKPNLSAMNLVP